MAKFGRNKDKNGKKDGAFRNEGGNRRKKRFDSDTGFGERSKFREESFEDYSKNRTERGSGGRSDRRGSFGGRRGDRGDRDNNRGSRLSMTRVICDSCGESCEVPFKPSSDKPVYCSDCFSSRGGKDGGSSDRRGDSGRDVKRELDIINEKLDKIMKILHII